jgi:succinate dehydrogenase / fumarate reductase iron-sulfur subunit
VRLLLRVFRFDPSRDAAPRHVEYGVEAEPGDRILDCLTAIRWEQDPTLAFRASCAHGVCGSDGMRIDGLCSLACQRLVREFAPEKPVTIDPLPGFPVLRDLVVSLDGFFEMHRSVQPYLRPSGPPPETERLQSPEQRQAFDDAIRCILCACCTSACPVHAGSPAFVGPAALLRAFRYLFDSRDAAADERLRLLDSPEGAGGCRMHQECTKVCPKQIPVSRCIGRVKRRIFESKPSRQAP